MLLMFFVLIKPVYLCYFPFSNICMLDALIRGINCLCFSLIPNKIILPKIIILANCVYPKIIKLYQIVYILPKKKHNHYFKFIILPKMTNYHNYKCQNTIGRDGRNYRIYCIFFNGRKNAFWKPRDERGK